MEQSHILNLLIAGQDSTVPVTAAAAYIESYADLDDGAFSVCNDQNMVLSATTVLTDARTLANGIRLIGRYGTKLVMSDLIKATDLISSNGTTVVAAANQVSYIGYNGSTGSIAAIVDNVYKLNLQVDTISRTGRGNTFPINVMFRSSATATTTEVAFGLIGNLTPTLKNQSEECIKSRLINSAAVTAGHQFDHTVAVVKGSKYVVVSTDLITHDAGHTAVAGDLIRLGTAALIEGQTVLTSPVYKIIAVSTLTLELDRPVECASGTYTADQSAELIPAAAIGDYGIRLDGVSPTWVLGKRPWSKYTFTIGLTDFSATTTVTYTTPASLGRGVEQQIRDLEWFTQGEAGDRYRADYMYQGYTSRVVASETYKQISLSWASKSRQEGIGGAGHNPKQLIIALATTADDNDANDIIIDVLNAFTAKTLLASY
jgi:hypothetical protein